MLSSSWFNYLPSNLSYRHNPYPTDPFKHIFGNFVFILLILIHLLGYKAEYRPELSFCYIVYLCFFRGPPRRRHFVVVVVVCLFVFGATAPSGPGPPHSRGF